MAKKKAKAASSPTLKAGDHVEWNTPQGETEGRVVRKVTGKAKAGGHVAHASKEEPQFEVESDKSGKTAIHKAEGLKKAPKRASKK